MTSDLLCSPETSSVSVRGVDRSAAHRYKMTVLFAGWWSEFFTVAVTVFLFSYLYFKFFTSQYWKNRNVAHLKPVFLLGNLWRAAYFESLPWLLASFYHKWKDQKVVGFWNFGTPTLLLNDLDVIKSVLTSDFSHFRDRRMNSTDFSHDPLAGNLFNLGGAKWRNLRVKLTPTFTSGKMKMMFPTVVGCGKVLQDYLSKVADSKEEVEVKEILARFGTDVISSCAFGIETNSIQNPNSEFWQLGRKIFEPNLKVTFNRLILNSSPWLFKTLKLQVAPKEVTEFFVNAVKETMDYREKNNIKRNDFMELLIQLKNKGKLQDVDGVVSGLPEEELKFAEDMKFTFLEAAAQAFVFFFAGFETTSTTISFALYELAINTDIQDRLVKEIDQMLKENGGEMTYDGVHNAEYLDRVVQETLRKYPPVAALFRQCNKDYEIKGMDIVIPRKMVVMVPTLGIHRDHQYYPNPEKFDPDRFAPEEREKRHHFAFLPFGEGPRNCIGNRFGLMQSKIGLVTILSKFRVEVGSTTPIPLKFDKKILLLTSESGIHLKFVKRH